MIENLTLKPITFASFHYKDVNNLYIKAFPKNERLPLSLLTFRAMGHAIDFLSLHDGDSFVGFCYLVTKDNLTFVFYLAIDDTKRGKGYGSKALEAIDNYCSSSRIILNIESQDETSTNADQREKRKKFYLKNGYRSTSIKVIEMNACYEMLIYGEENIEQSDYIHIMKVFATPLFAPFVKNQIKFI